MKITSLMDDVCHNPRLKKEHGLSIHIADGDKQYLLDTGATRKFDDNARRLGIDIKAIDALFISHNHYDHTGGLKHFLNTNKKAKVYLKDDAMYDYYAKPFNIKVSGKSSVFTKFRSRIRPIEFAYKIGDIHILSDQNGDEDFFCQDTRLYKRVGKKYVPDTFDHELFLAVEDKDKVHIISSCSHRGIVNILSTARTQFKKPIGTVYAGLHMSKNSGKAMNCTADYFEKVCDAMDDIGFDMLYTCHCTGLFAFDKLKARFGEKISYISTGESIEI
jgi:7,8-dihydropterin-6-yl-methyl-4-(beta-D-ribofuranosyl)aminobenzene 5'-phosphate synthase